MSRAINYYLLFLFVFFLFQGCVSRALFGYSDKHTDILMSKYKQKVRREIERKKRISEKVYVKKALRRSKTKGKLTIGLKNAICLATTGNLLPNSSEKTVLVQRKEYGFHSMLGKSFVPPGNQDFLSRTEQIHTTALSLISTKHSWNPQLTGTISMLYNYDRVNEGYENSTNAKFSVGVTQKLPFGGSVSLNMNTEHRNNYSDINSRSSSIGVTGSISQPLLKNFGYDQAHEEVFLAQRNLVYQIRDFELFRQDFTIDVMQRYYDLIRRKQVVKNNKRSYDQSLFVLRQTKALYEKLGEKTTIDVLRAELREQQSKDAYEDAVRAYKETLDSFKIFLGLDPTSKLELKEEVPEFKELNIKTSKAQRYALNNRLDLLNRWEQLQDTHRSITYEKRNLLPSLDLNLGFSLGHGTIQDFDRAALKFQNFNAGLTLEIPFDRVIQQNRIKSQIINFKRDIRGFFLEINNIKRQIQNNIRNLEQLKKSMRNQQRQIEIARKKGKKAFLDFKEGQISNRDLVEAQEELRDAENAFIQTQVNYEITRLRLLRNMGKLFINKYGIIRED